MGLMKSTKGNNPKRVHCRVMVPR